jgi:hypothetical protein
MIAAGATRIGTSGGLRIVQEFTAGTVAEANGAPAAREGAQGKEGVY